MKIGRLTLFSLIALFFLTAAGIDLGNLFNYEGLTVPNYIVQDNTAGNAITN